MLAPHRRRTVRNDLRSVMSASPVRAIIIIRTLP